MCIAISELQRNGIGFNWLSYSQELLIEKQNQRTEQLCQLAKLLNISIDEVSKPTKIIWELYKHGLRPASLSFEYLKEHREEHVAYKHLYTIKRLEQFINQYGNKLSSQICADGRIHADWLWNGTITGRMGCRNPNLQAFPKSMKKYFCPANNHRFVTADYSQIELRVLADMSKDKALIQAFQDGLDIHCVTASHIYRKPIEEINDIERSIAKKVNFGICYGISNQGLCEMINKVSTLSIDIQAANTLKNYFYQAYPGLYRFHNHLLTTPVITSLGGQRWVDYPRGISRVNLPVQASAAEGFKLALELLCSSLPKGYLLVNAIHDEIVLEVPEGEQIAAADLLRLCMVDGMSSLVKSVPIEVTID